jgi:hypothetical protein
MDEGQETVWASAIRWTDDDGNDAFTIETGADGGLVVTTYGDRKIGVSEAEKFQLLDFLNEKFTVEESVEMVPASPKMDSDGDPAVSEPGRFEPLTEDHPAVGMICPGCQTALDVGDKPAMVAIGPGDNKEAREKARANRPYTGVAVVCHEECVHG